MKVPAFLAVMMSCAVLAACSSAETPPADTGAFGTGAAGTGADGTSINDPALNDTGAGMDTTLSPSPELDPATGTYTSDPVSDPVAPRAGTELDAGDAASDGATSTTDGASQDQPLD